MLTIGLFAVGVYCVWKLLSGASSDIDHSIISSYDAVTDLKGTSDTDATHIVPEVATLRSSTFRTSKHVPTVFGTGDQQALPAKLPRIQYEFDQSAKSQDERLATVKEAFEHSWSGYKKYAWLKDELAPTSARYRNNFSGWAATLIDSLDTLWILGMRAEFEEAVAAVEYINFNIPCGLPINVFETTIRYLGGLLGAYDVSNAQYPILLEKATEVGDMLLEAFNTPSRMPVLHWNKISVEVAPGDAAMSELGSLSLEFIRLSQLTSDKKYEGAIERISRCIYDQQMSTMIPGLLPTTVNARECDFSQGMEFTLGAHADSAYEYMVKAHQLIAGRTSMYREMYMRALEPIKQHLLFRPMTSTNSDVLLAGAIKVYRRTQVESITQTRGSVMLRGRNGCACLEIFLSA